MSNKKLKTLAALTSALLVVNAGAASFVANAAGSGSFVTVDGDSNDSSNSHVSIFGGEYITLPQIEDDRNEFSSAGFNSVIKTPETYNVSYISGEYSTLLQINDTDRYDLSIEAQPEKTVYLTGEELDLTGLELACLHQPDSSDEIWNGYYFDTYEIPLSELIENGTIIIDDSEFDNTKAGFYNIYITYGNVTESVRVRVKEVKEQDKIAITSEPTNTIHKIGEELDLTGTRLILKDKESNEKVEYYDIYELIDNGTITVDSSEFDNTQEGIYPIFITYDGETVEFDVRVMYLTESYSIFICEPPTKTVYQFGEELDITGTKIYGSYTDGELVGDIFPTDLAPYLENGMMTFDDSEFDNTKAGTYTIYIHNGTATASFEVTVNGEELLPKGDANGDGEFTIADIVTVQKSIMSRKTAILADCKAADLYEDGVIDVYDFILMRKEIIKK